MNGLTRPREFTAVNALSFSDLDQARMSNANAVFSMLQHMGKAMGAAIYPAHRIASRIWTPTR